MEKASVPTPTATSRASALSPAMKLAQDCWKLGSGAVAWRGRDWPRASCFHTAMPFRTMVATPAPWITCTRRPLEKSASSAPKISALTIEPASSATYMRPTTLGCFSGGVRSVASAKPTVWVMCSPVPTSRKARPAATWPMIGGTSAAWPCWASTSSAKGIIASPPNCTMVPL